MIFTKYVCFLCSIPTQDVIIQYTDKCKSTVKVPRGGGTPIDGSPHCYNSEGTILTDFSAIEGRVSSNVPLREGLKAFEQKMCARKGMVFPVVVPGKVQNVTDCIKLAELSVLHGNNFTNKQLMNTSCATEGILFCGFVPVRVWIWVQILCQFWAFEGRGFAGGS